MSPNEHEVQEEASTGATALAISTQYTRFLSFITGQCASARFEQPVQRTALRARLNLGAPQNRSTTYRRLGV